VGFRNDTEGRFGRTKKRPRIGISNVFRKRKQTHYFSFAFSFRKVNEMVTRSRHTEETTHPALLGINWIFVFVFVLGARYSIINRRGTPATNDKEKGSLDDLMAVFFLGLLLWAKVVGNVSDSTAESSTNGIAARENTLRLWD
jgi:hypothetical protein